MTLSGLIDLLNAQEVGTMCLFTIWVYLKQPNGMWLELDLQAPTDVAFVARQLEVAEAFTLY